MKKIIFLILIINCNYLIAQDISGTWNWQYENGKHNAQMVLENSSTNSFEGSYCSAFYNGDKIDCDKELNEICINVSKISENIYEGIFTSPSFDGTGQIRLTYSPTFGSLTMQILSSEGEFYLPENALFK